MSLSSVIGNTASMPDLSWPSFIPANTVVQKRWRMGVKSEKCFCAS